MDYKLQNDLILPVRERYHEKLKISWLQIILFSSLYSELYSYKMVAKVDKIDSLFVTDFPEQLFMPYVQV